MTKEVFVSYSRDDSSFADRLATDLSAKGIEVWMDKKRIKPGDPWDSTVQKALIDCEYFMVVLSPISVSSQNVLDEITYALNNNKRILPVLVLDIKDSDIPLRVSRLQWIDFRKSYDAGFANLIAEFVRYGFVIQPAEVTPGSDTMVDRSKDLKGYYVQAESSFLLENWENAIANYQAIINIQPDYRDAAKKLDQSRLSLNHEKYYNQAVSAMEKKDWEQAIAMIVKIHVDAPAYKDTDSLLIKARDQKSLADLYDAAQQATGREQWQDVITTLDKIHAKDPSYPDPRNLRKIASDKLDERKAEELYALGLSEMSAQNYSKAYALFNQVYQINPNYLETRKLIKKIEGMGVISNVLPVVKKEPAKTATPHSQKMPETSAVPGQRKSNNKNNWILLIAISVMVTICVCCPTAYYIITH